jgi:hypothetical protein
LIILSITQANNSINHTNTANMSELKVGDNFPEGVFFSYIQPTPEIAEFSTCGAPTNYNASQGM